MIAKKSSKRKISFNQWFFIFGALIAVFLIESWRLFKYNQRFENKIYPNVYIDKRNFGGKTKNEVVSYFQTKSLPLNKISLTILFENEPVATFSGQQLGLKYDGQTAAERAFLIGRSKFFLSGYYQKTVSLLNLGRYDFISNIEYNKADVADRLESIKEQYDKPAKNALFKFENGRVVSFRKEEKGQEIMKDSVLTDVDNAIQSIKNRPKNKSIKINPRIIEPEITLASINNFGIEELIAEGRSDFSHSIPERIHNVILSASKFNGVLIAPGKTLSFNETVGDISSLTGYKPAYIIKEGKTVLGDGGGVCQVSTTLFRAALNAGLPILERNAHAYRVSYYENDMKPGFDATVFSPSVDLKIKNDTPAHILIETEVDEERNLLYFRFYGKKDGRRVEISPSTIWDVVPPPEPRYQEDPTLKKDVVKQIDFPAWGSKASFTYKVFKENNLVIDQKFFSNYRPWQAVFLVGTVD
ncbi:MAG: VanW family protein [Candidatus Roizmanbacteria bacterium GW2011_GWC2_37_13]|uniref:VanW family protein n=1 Tax=Candidatus Roizmanbacteria bacterium GW2011_GWC2_37_13 TaxID=1618486 RepID=A0A0G0GKD7_9BACT|nr:MAG: VanW family protein [Candidatus Roizmanbacteria bacterium GW2011_GWC1_37_12]KKQ26585.1 MAG: VanW family protein [Candidatus Roizmanbacteria bacterium GW2011_GWC2_37_13]